MITGQTLKDFWTINLVYCLNYMDASYPNFPTESETYMIDEFKTNDRIDIHLNDLDMFAHALEVDMKSAEMLLIRIVRRIAFNGVVDWTSCGKKEYRNINDYLEFRERLAALGGKLCAKHIEKMGAEFIHKAPSAKTKKNTKVVQLDAWGGKNAI